MTPPAPAADEPRTLGVDLASLAACSVIWGTTWFVITLQFGAVPAEWSVAYRFAIAATALFGWCAITRRELKLTRGQHGWAALQGLFVFALNYGLVYAAEARVLSGVVAVIFAAMALINIVAFRLTLGRSASGFAWAGAVLGVVGVAVLSASELLKTGLDPKTTAGVGLAFAAVVCGAVGNVFAAKLHDSGAKVAASTAWAMLYGSAMLAVWAAATGHAPAFEFSVRYIGSLLYLAVFGSVIAFIVYYLLARRRGYTFAAYISALTPPTAMLVSSVFEHATWGWGALAGLVLVLAGQLLLIKAPRASA